jgi:hypothetical protein
VIVFRLQQEGWRCLRGDMEVRIQAEDWIGARW